MKLLRRALLVAALGTLIAGALAQPASATVVRAWSGSGHPEDYRLTANQAFELAATPEVRRLARAVNGAVKVKTSSYEPRHWIVEFEKSNGDLLAEVHIDDRRARIIHVWTGREANWHTARGSKALVDEGQIGSLTDSVWVWLPLSLLFVLPFIDFRQARRRVHLDLGLFLAFVVAHTFVVKGDLNAWVPAMYACLALLLVRLVCAARHRDDTTERLVPHLSTPVLAVGAVALLVGRAVMNAVDSVPLDVAYGSVAGADRIIHGLTLYTSGGGHYDTYGPFTYLFYVPFNLVLPFHGVSDVNLVPAHVVAIALDAAIAIALFLCGRSLRGRTRAGTELGVALAYLWVAYPFTWYILANNTNDNLVGLFTLLCALLLRRPILAGVMLGLAVSAKFAPIAMLPLAAATGGVRDRRSALAVVAATLATFLLTVALVVSPGELRAFYDATIGFQLGRVDDPNSLWGQHPGLWPLQSAIRLAVVAFALALPLVVRRADMRQIAALGAAVLLAVQLPLGHFTDLYMVWYLPLALLATFGAHASRAGS